MSTPKSPTQTDLAVRAAFEAHGYVQANGAIDLTKLRETMIRPLIERKVVSYKERGEKAVTRGELVAHVFPDLPGPDAFDDQPDPRLAQDVWDALSAKLWNEAAVNADKPLQRMVAIEMGNGYVLCRTQIGSNKTAAVYVTDDVRCIETDFVKPDNDALQRKAKAVTDNREMLVLRQPHNAKRYERGINETLKAIADTSRQRVALAVAASTAPAPSDDRDADEG